MSHESPEVPVSPVSEGQGLEQDLKETAAKNACVSVSDKAEKKRFRLARDLRALEKKSDGN